MEGEMYGLSDCAEPTFRVFIDIWFMGGGGGEYVKITLRTRYRWGGGERVCKVTLCTCSPTPTPHPPTHTAMGWRIIGIQNTDHRNSCT
jgi:hypothetical protein